MPPLEPIERCAWIGILAIDDQIFGNWSTASLPPSQMSHEVSRWNSNETISAKSGFGCAIVDTGWLAVSPSGPV